MSSWYDNFNPFASEDTYWDYVPGVSNARGVARGDWGAAIDPTGGGYNAVRDIRDAGSAVGKWAEGVGGDIKDAFNKPYEDKAKGYDAIRAETDRLKKERMAQKDFAYNLADSKYQPSRDALAAVYGDPKSWRL
jgi:hypothetical protein